MRTYKVIQEPLYRHMYPTYGGSHIAMSRVPNDHHVSYDPPKQVFSSIQYAVRDKMDPWYLTNINYLYEEQRRVR